MKTMKKLMMVVGGCLLATGVAQAELVEYRDYDAATGTFTNAVRECTLVTPGTRTLESGWYAVTGEVEIPEGTNLAVVGSAHIVLCDGASLTANGGDMLPGVSVVPGNALSIYAQTAGTGRLTATGGRSSAGIGGGGSQDGGAVTICGGTIVAQGGEGAAGIGGGRNYFYGGGGGGTIAIHGGTVTATGGGGERYIAGAGIGGGYGGSGGRVTIDGGAVSASGGEADVDPIGNGCNGLDCQVVVSGGLFSFRPRDAWIPSGYGAAENTDEATRGTYPWKVVSARSCTVRIGPHPRMIAAWTSGDGSVTNAIEGESARVPFGAVVRVIFAADYCYSLIGESVVNLGKVTGDVTFGVGNDYRVPNVVIVYRDYDAASGTFTNAVCTEYEFLTSRMEELLGGKTYVVDGKGETESGLGGITVKGAVRLILLDSADFAAHGLTDQAGIVVPEGCSLTIFGQAAGLGKLTAHGGIGAAGIGCSEDGTCGTITIDGGIVEARGGDVGDGERTPVFLHGYGIGGTNGVVTINGGSVTATGGNPIASGSHDAKSICGQLTFGAAVADSALVGASATNARLMPLADCLTNRTKYVSAPKVGILLPKTRGLTYIVSNGTQEVLPVVSGDLLSYVVGVGESLTISFQLQPGYIYVREAPVVPLEIPNVTGAVEVDSADLPVVAVEPVSYRAWDAENHMLTNAVSSDYLYVLPETSVFENGRTYRVAGSITNATNGINVDGSALLILDDGASLVVKGTDVGAGVHVGPGSSFTVCGQVEGTGLLRATGGSRQTYYGDQGGAGIGGFYVYSSGSITINGGTIEAQGGHHCAGIGGAQQCSAGPITINGGTVTATGGKEASAIGKGYNGSVSGAFTLDENVTWTLEAGADAASAVRVSAQAYRDDHSAKYVHIVEHPKSPVAYIDALGQSQTVDAYEIGVDWPTSFEDGRWYVVKGTLERGRIVVNGAAHLILCDGAALTVSATDGSNQSGLNVSSNGSVTNSLSIYGQTASTGSLVAYGNKYGAGIGGDLNGSGGVVNIHGGRVQAVSGVINVAGIGGGYQGAAGTVTLGRSRIWSINAAWKVGAATSVSRTAYEADHGAEHVSITPGELKVPVWYRAADDSIQTNLCAIVTTGTDYFEDGDWYAVTCSVKRTGISVFGGANLILCDGAKLRVEGGGNQAGINVSCNGSVTNSLSIYGQTKDTGRLEAMGGTFAAGIGGARDGSAGSLTVYGGILSAEGIRDAAGIGGGSGGSGGTVTINGGRVYATGNYGAGIGGGRDGAGGAVTVNGGTVYTKGDTNARDIGRGPGSGSNGMIVINGGNVKGYAGVFNAAVNGKGQRLVPVTISCGRIRDVDVLLSLDGLSDYGTNDIYELGGNTDIEGFYVRLWLPSGTYNFTLSDGERTYRYEAVVNMSPVNLGPLSGSVTPGARLAFGSYLEAVGASEIAVLTPSEDVAKALGEDEVRRITYARKFRFVITSEGDVWYVEAALTPTAQKELAATATKATRQIPVAEIAALMEGTKDVPVKDCEPGFYYTLYGGQGLTALPKTGTAYRAEPCSAEGTVLFPAVEKPSDAAGFFTIGVSATKGE